MIIKYGDEELINEKEAEKILKSLPYRYCFITGSFLFNKKYKDIDVFVITRSKKDISLKDKKINITKIDFNDLYSLFYHSISKTCIAKNILPQRPLKVTVADYWDVVNEAVPSILNNKNFMKDVRLLVLYITYFKDNKVLGSLELKKELKKFKNKNAIMNYINREVPKGINKKVNKSYVKRYFYTQAGFYKENTPYKGQRYLYEITHRIIHNTS